MFPTDGGEESNQRLTAAVAMGSSRRPRSYSPTRWRKIHHNRDDAGAEVRTKPAQTQPMPASNQRTPTQARKTESHIVDAPTMSGVRVSPLPRRLPLLTNQIAQKGSAKLSACNALTPDETTSGSDEKIRMRCSLKMYTSRPPMPSQANAQRREMSHAFRASEG